MRRVPVSILMMALLAVTSAFAGDGMVSVESSFGVGETADRLERLVKEKGLTLFNRIDHAKGASSIGMELRPTELLIFGNPQGGTPLMKCRQSVGIDLPLKMLVWEDGGGTTRVSYNEMEYLKERHGITGCDEALRKINGALERLAHDAAHSGS